LWNHFKTGLFDGSYLGSHNWNFYQNKRSWIQGH